MFVAMTPTLESICTLYSNPPPLKKPLLSEYFYYYYCESTFIHWNQFSWFLQTAVIHGFLNSWFQTLHFTGNIQRENGISFDFYFRRLSGPLNQRTLEPDD